MILFLIIVIIINNLHKCEYSAKPINQILYTVVKHLKWVGIHRYSAKKLWNWFVCYALFIVSVVRFAEYRYTMLCCQLNELLGKAI